jgi:hypothetical protein
MKNNGMAYFLFCMWRQVGQGHFHTSAEVFVATLLGEQKESYRSC